MKTNPSKPGSEPKQQGGQGKDADRQQQAQTGEGQQYGEGNYRATRQYNDGLKDHVEHHDIEREARDAAPRTAAEEQQMAEAERIGRSKSRGEGRPAPDGDAADEENAQ